MGLLESWMFRGWPRPTKPAVLTLDLDEARLGSFALGSPARSLAESLGPPASYWLMRRRGWWLYPESGLAFEEKDGHIIYMAIVSAHPEASLLQGFVARFRPFSGLVRLRHGTERASSLREETFRGLFGDPVEADRDPNEAVLTFRKGEVAVEAEFLPSGQLKHLAFFEA
jgi:hypothetical protein